jgi:hypothetical protein
MYKTPFSDAIEKSPVPKKGSKGGEYDSKEFPDSPGRDTSPNGVAELHRDTAVTSKSPSTNGMIKTPFKDAVD